MVSYIANKRFIIYRTMVPRGYYLGSWVLTVTLLTFPIGNDLHSDVNSDHGDPNGIPWAKCNGIKATNVCLVFVKICENGHQRAPKKTKGMIFSWIGRQGRRGRGAFNVSENLP